MLVLEAALRGGAVTLLLLIGALLLRDEGRTTSGRYGGFLAWSVAAYVVVSAPYLFGDGAPWLIPLRLVSLGNPALFWLFAAACFDDEFEPSWHRATVWFGAVALGGACAFGGRTVVCLAYAGSSLVFVGLALRQALVGRAADLVEGRRRFRIVLVVVAGLYTAAITVSEFSSHGHATADLSGLVNAFGIAALAFWIAAARLSFPTRGRWITVVPDGPGPALREASPEKPSVPPEADEQETALLAALRRLMEEEKAYREEGLSVAGLASRLGIPEYRLRRLINQRLGHRNFSAFVNGYRLAEAMAALADPTQAEVPVLTIALDAGFQSIGPFNRAFKAHAGMTPTEYRRLHLGRAEKTAGP